MTYTFQLQATPTADQWQTDEKLLLQNFNDLVIADHLDTTTGVTPAFTTYHQLDSDPVIHKDGKAYHFSNSHYYNWYKNLQLNVLGSENFTHYFVRMQRNDADHFRLAEKMLYLVTLVSFLEQLDDHDTFCLLFAAWSYFFNTQAPDQARDYLANFLMNYTIQKNDLVGLNQLTASLNQVMLQHFPRIRKQDLRLIYRLLELVNADSQQITDSLAILNDSAATRTKKCLAYLQDVKGLTWFELPLLEQLQNSISFQLLNSSKELFTNQ